jgi:hypothetical protein
MVHGSPLPVDWSEQVTRAYTVFGAREPAYTEFGFREWLEHLHPRDREGKWREVLGRLTRREQQARARTDRVNSEPEVSPIDVPDFFPNIPGDRNYPSVMEDVPDVERVGHQRGSNPGGMYRLRNKDIGAAEGVYVKRAQSPDHGYNEQLANLLYKALGVRTPEVRYNEDDGHIYSTLIDGKGDMEDRVDDPEWMDKFYRDFAIDAWLANWDVIGGMFDNVITDERSGEPARIDAGGSLLYRARGAPKGEAFGDKVGELETFKSDWRNGHLYDDMTLEQELDGARRLQQMNPAHLRELIERNSPEGGFDLDPNIARTILARRKSIFDHYGLDDPYA